MKRALRLYPALFFCFLFSVFLAQISGYFSNIEFPIKTRSPKITFAISTKNTVDPPSFINAMMVGEPEEDFAQFILSQAPPNTGYFLTLSVLAGDDSDD